MVLPVRTRIFAPGGIGEIGEIAAAAIADLDPDAGTVLRVVWFDAGPDAPGRLLLVAHHLVTDALSWPVMIGDLATAWAAAERGTPPASAPVPT